MGPNQSAASESGRPTEIEITLEKRRARKSTWLVCHLCWGWPDRRCRDCSLLVA